MSITISERLRNNFVVKQYLQTIRDGEIETVRQLQENIQRQAGEHPVYKNTLKPEFEKRLG